MEWIWERRMATHLYRNSTVLFHFVHTSRMGTSMGSPYKSLLILWKYFFEYCTGATESDVVWKYKITWWAILGGWSHPRAAKSWGSVCSALFCSSSHDVLTQTGLGALGTRLWCWMAIGEFLSYEVFSSIPFMRHLTARIRCIFALLEMQTNILQQFKSLSRSRRRDRSVHFVLTLWRNLNGEKGHLSVFLSFCPI